EAERGEELEDVVVEDLAREDPLRAVQDDALVGRVQGGREGEEIDERGGREERTEDTVRGEEAPHRRSSGGGRSGGARAVVKPGAGAEQRPRRRSRADCGAGKRHRRRVSV